MEKMGAEKKITISISCSEEKKYVEVCVTDTGIGIESKHVSEIFRFGFSTKKNGHGYGLHSSALAAKELGGYLQMNSEGKGYGASFILGLPYKIVQ